MSALDDFIASPASKGSALDAFLAKPKAQPKPAPRRTVARPSATPPVTPLAGGNSDLMSDYNAMSKRKPAPKPQPAPRAMTPNELMARQVQGAHQTRAGRWVDKAIAGVPQGIRDLETMGQKGVKGLLEAEEQASGVRTAASATILRNPKIQKQGLDMVREAEKYTSDPEYNEAAAMLATMPLFQMGGMLPKALTRAAELGLTAMGVKELPGQLARGELVPAALSAGMVVPGFHAVKGIAQDVRGLRAPSTRPLPPKPMDLPPRVAPTLLSSGEPYGPMRPRFDEGMPSQGIPAPASRPMPFDVAGIVDEPPVFSPGLPVPPQRPVPVPNLASMARTRAPEPVVPKAKAPRKAAPKAPKGKAVETPYVSSTSITANDASSTPGVVFNVMTKGEGPEYIPQLKGSVRTYEEAVAKAERISLTPNIRVYVEAVHPTWGKNRRITDFPERVGEYPNPDIAPAPVVEPAAPPAAPKAKAPRKASPKVVKAKVNTEPSEMTDTAQTIADFHAEMEAARGAGYAKLQGGEYEVGSVHTTPNGQKAIVSAVDDMGDPHSFIKVRDAQGNEYELSMSEAHRNLTPTGETAPVPPVAPLAEPTKKLYRGVPLSPERGGVADPEARFGAAEYWTDNPRTAEKFAEVYRGGGRVDEGEWTGSKTLNLTDSSTLDTTTPEYARLLDILEREGISRANAERWLSGDYDVQMDPFSFLARRISRGEPSARWQGAQRMNELVREAGYDSIIAPNPGSELMPSHNEYVYLRDNSASPTPAPPAAPKAPKQAQAAPPEPVAAPPVESPAAREPWQMTREEYWKESVRESEELYRTAKPNARGQKADTRKNASDRFAVDQYHKNKVRQAIAEGKITSHPDYPDLAPKPTPAPKTPEPVAPVETAKAAETTQNGESVTHHWWNDVEKTWVPASGKSLKVDGYATRRFFVRQDGKRWVVDDSVTGGRIAEGSTREVAVLNAHSKLASTGAKEFLERKTTEFRTAHGDAPAVAPAPKPSRKGQRGMMIVPDLPEWRPTWDAAREAFVDPQGRVVKEPLLRAFASAGWSASKAPAAVTPNVTTSLSASQAEPAKAQEGATAPAADVASIRKAELQDARMSLGMDPVPEGEVYHNLDAVARSKAEGLSTKIVDIARQAAKDRRGLTPEEAAGAVARRIDFEKEILAAKGDDAKLARVMQEFNEFTDNVRATQKAAGQSVQANKIGLDREDYSLSTALVDARNAAGGRELAPAEIRELDAAVAEVERLKAEVAKSEQQRAAEAAAHEAELTRIKAERELKRTAVKSKGEAARTQAQAERKVHLTRLNELMNRASSGLDPEIAWELGQVAKTYVKEGAATLDEVVRLTMLDVKDFTRDQIIEAIIAPNPTKKPVAEGTKRLLGVKREATLADVQKQVKTGDVKGPTKRPRPVFDKTQTDLYIARRKVRQIIAAKQPTGVYELLQNTAREGMLGTDLSGHGRQALALTLRMMVSDAKTAGSVHLEALRAALNPRTAAELAARDANDPVFVDYLRDGGAYEEMGGGKTSGSEYWQASPLEKVPVWGRLLKASERDFVTVTNRIRFEYYKMFREAYPDATLEQRKGIVDIANKMTGRGDIGGAGWLSKVFLAPRNAAATWQQFDLPRKYWGDPVLRGEVAKIWGAKIGFGLATCTLAKLAGAEVHTDPDDPAFGDITLGKLHWNTFGTAKAPARLILRANTNRMRGKDFNWRDVAGGQVTQKLAPVPSMYLELTSGKDAIGQKVTIPETLLGSFVPLSSQAAVEGYKEAGLPGAAAIGLPNILGIDTNVYDAKKKSASKTKRSWP